MKAMILTTSQIGTSASSIRSYILNGYNTWDIRPEYILIAGSNSYVPASGNSDDYYADMVGNFRIELSVGRFPCSSLSQIQNLVAKTLVAGTFLLDPVAPLTFTGSFSAFSGVKSLTYCFSSSIP
jgi:hypothetical protein